MEQDKKVRKKSRTILVSPLEWGLGHTARLVPVIRACLASKHKVIIAADGKSLNFLRRNFPNLEWERLPFKKISYSRNDKLITNILTQIPGFIAAIRRDTRRIKVLIKKHNIDLIISDNRYGLYHKDVQSVFITSQMWLIAPQGWRWGEKFVFLIHKRFLRKFTHIWFADFPGDINITGRQTHLPEPYLKARFVNPLSRFTDHKTEKKPEFFSEILVIISGPEPQRSILEVQISDLLRNSGKETIILRGLPPPPDSAPSTPVKDGFILWFDHADNDTIYHLMHSAKKIISRPGISMLSDLTALGKTALLIPTPGQTEQEYMAGHLADQGFFSLTRQKDLSMEKIDSFDPGQLKQFPKPNLSELEKAINELGD